MRRLLTIVVFPLVLSACQAPWLHKETETPPPPSAVEDSKNAQGAEKPVHVAPQAPPAAAKPAPAVKHEMSDPIPAATSINKKGGEEQLREGQLAYANGDYDVAARRFDVALTMGLSKQNDRLLAWKYLAFISCAKDQQAACRHYFRRMLLVNPKAELNPAERDHPLWGPVFIEVKQEMRSKK